MSQRLKGETRAGLSSLLASQLAAVVVLVVVVWIGQARGAIGGQDFLIELTPDGQLLGLPSEYEPAHLHWPADASTERAILRLGRNRLEFPDCLSVLFAKASRRHVKLMASWNGDPSLVPDYLSIRLPTSAPTAHGFYDGWLILIDLKRAKVLRVEAVFTLAQEASQRRQTIDIKTFCGPGTRTDEETESVCREVLCRPSRAIHLKLKDGRTFQRAPSRPMPIVIAGLVTVWPDETVFVEARVQDGHLTDLTAVESIRDPERTLVLSLRQDPTVGDGVGMVLEVKSPFEGVLQYYLGAQRVDHEELLRTTVCPLTKDKPVVKHWPFPVIKVVATSFRFVDESSGETRSCED